MTTYTPNPIQAKPLVVTALPTPGADYEGQTVRIEGTASSRSRTYRCERNDDGSWRWIPISSGGDQ